MDKGFCCTEIDLLKRTIGLNSHLLVRRDYLVSNKSCARLLCIICECFLSPCIGVAGINGIIDISKLYKIKSEFICHREPATNKSCINMTRMNLSLRLFSWIWDIC